MHAWFASRQQARAGDLDAAARYERLADLAEDAEQRRYRLEQAIAARASAANNHAEMAARLAGKWRSSIADRRGAP